MYKNICSPQYILTKCTDIMPYIMESRNYNYNSNKLWYRVYCNSNFVDICSDDHYINLNIRFDKIKDKVITINSRKNNKYDFILQFHDKINVTVLPNKENIKYEVVFNKIEIFNKTLDEDNYEDDDGDEVIEYDDEKSENYDEYYD